MDASYHPDLAAARALREWREEYERLNNILRTRPHDLPESHRFAELEALLGLNDDNEPTA